MSSTYIPAELRRRVAARADALCEYCLMAEEDTFFGCEVDHIVSEKHGGVTEEGNLALACFTCNRYKGSDVGSVVSGRLVRFFDPRKDQWAEHFSLDEHDLRINPLGDVGSPPSISSASTTPSAYSSAKHCSRPAATPHPPPCSE